MIRLALLLLLMCENVNAAPQEQAIRKPSSGAEDVGAAHEGKPDSLVTSPKNSIPAVAAPINAAQQVSLPARMGREAEADSRQVESATSARANPAGAAPFTLSHPLCQTGFTIAQRFDERNSAGTIIKSVWVRKCTKGKIIYGGKV